MSVDPDLTDWETDRHLHRPDQRGWCFTCSTRMPCDWSVALDDMKRAVARIEELEVRLIGEQRTSTAYRERITELEAELWAVKRQRGEADTRIEQLEAALRDVEGFCDVIEAALPTCANVLRNTVRRALGDNHE